jgi:hypothetical protein
MFNILYNPQTKMIKLINMNFLVTKSLARMLTMLLILAFFTVLSSCGDDEKPANRLKVDGNSLKLKNAYLIFASGTLEDEEYSENIGFITTDGLTYDYEEDEFVGTGDMIIFFLVSEGATLQKDTYELDDSPSIGDLVFFQVGISIVDGEPTEAIYYGVEGNLKVTSISESKMTVKFDFDEYEFETPEDDGTGEGSMTGYYSGKVEIYDETSVATRKGEKLKSIREKLILRKQ